MTRTIILAVSAFALSGSAAVAAANGWDWDEEIQFRIWRTATLQWAQDLHPQHPTISYLANAVNPPPRELWCADPGTPTYADCEEHKARLELWAENTFGYFTPAEDLDWPRECPSSCYP